MVVENIGGAWLPEEMVWWKVLVVLDYSKKWSGGKYPIPTVIKRNVRNRQYTVYVVDSIGNLSLQHPFRRFHVLAKGFGRFLPTYLKVDTVHRNFNKMGATSVWSMALSPCTFLPLRLLLSTVVHYGDTHGLPHRLNLLLNGTSRSEFFYSHSMEQFWRTSLSSANEFELLIECGRPLIIVVHLNAKSRLNLARWLSNYHPAGDPVSTFYLPVKLSCEYLTNSRVEALLHKRRRSASVVGRQALLNQLTQVDWAQPFWGLDLRPLHNRLLWKRVRDYWILFSYELLNNWQPWPLRNPKHWRNEPERVRSLVDGDPG